MICKQMLKVFFIFCPVGEKSVLKICRAERSGVGAYKCLTVVTVLSCAWLDVHVSDDMHGEVGGPSPPVKLQIEVEVRFESSCDLVESYI